MGAAMCKLSDKVGQHMKKRSPGCKYTCHATCQERVSLDCQTLVSPVSQDHLNNNHSALHIVLVIVH
ncbi:hypothetical protein D4764_22G0005150 [Takifugu flavidus]|uniref:Uncharacterized protein n=1 Tax=Takifugu flavidus TaxID=433684 RepID=A0A5C6ND76_9TELE|nr:hypothetical protein D4764_22G0005150 [Takifugu flavidus]